MFHLGLRASAQTSKVSQVASVGSQLPDLQIGRCRSTTVPKSPRHTNVLGFEAISRLVPYSINARLLPGTYARFSTIEQSRSYVQDKNLTMPTFQEAACPVLKSRLQIQTEYYTYARPRKLNSIRISCCFWSLCKTWLVYKCRGGRAWLIFAHVLASGLLITHYPPPSVN